MYGMIISNTKKGATFLMDEPPRNNVYTYISRNEMRVNKVISKLVKRIIHTLKDPHSPILNERC